MYQVNRIITYERKNANNPTPRITSSSYCSEIKRKIVEILDIKFVSIKFWADSQIVLKYIQKTNRNFPIFVINRLNEVRLNSHVPIGQIYVLGIFVENSHEIFPSLFGKSFQLNSAEYSEIIFREY